MFLDVPHWGPQILRRELNKDNQCGAERTAEDAGGIRRGLAWQSDTDISTVSLMTVVDAVLLPAFSMSFLFLVSVVKMLASSGVSCFQRRLSHINERLGQIVTKTWLIGDACLVSKGHWQRSRKIELCLEAQMKLHRHAQTRRRKWKLLHFFATQWFCGLELEVMKRMGKLLKTSDSKQHLEWQVDCVMHRSRW